MTIERLGPAHQVDGCGRGADLLAHALQRTVEAIIVGGGRLIVVDAIDEGAAAFYEHHGFRPTPADRFRLVMKASTAAASVGVSWP